MPGSSRWPRGGTAEQLRIPDKAPTLPCPAQPMRGPAVPCLFISSSPLSLQEIPFSAARGILMERWVLSLACSFNTRSQSPRFLGPQRKVWNSANQKNFLAPPGWSQYRHPAARVVVGGISHPDNVLAFENHQSSC